MINIYSFIDDEYLDIENINYQIQYCNIFHTIFISILKVLVNRHLATFVIVLYIIFGWSDKMNETQEV